VASAAFSQQNEMVATGSFLGEGLLSADLGAVAAETAATSGQASMDGVTYLRDATMQEISSESLGMRMMGLRETGNGIGTFEMNVFNREAGDNYAYNQAADTAGGSTSSYDLTGYRWNQNNPQIQLYLNPTDMPRSPTMTDDLARDAIAAAANTWDNAVAQNLFIDTNTVIVDYNKAVNNPSATTMDGYNVNGWWDFSGTNTLGLSSWWYNPDSVVGGYKSILESDIWYAKDKSWSTTGTGSAIDFQTVATHELGHSIGMGDLYTLPNGDPRKSDYAQIMNSYDAPQWTLGNGDRTGAQKLYGVNIFIPLVGDWQGTGKDMAGLYNSANGMFYFDYDNDGTSDARFKWTANLVPFVGDWQGTGKDMAGLYNPADGMFYFDYDNSGGSDARFGFTI
jgi:hypothetical protein